MRIGITYLYTIFKYGYPHSFDDALNALPDIQKLGFHYLEMEGLGRAHLNAVYKRRNELKQRLDDLGLHVHNFCVVDPEMVNLDERKRKKALEGFRLGADIGDLLGVETLHLASYAPPVKYIENKPYQLSGKGGYKFAGETRLKVPDDLNWDDVWAALVDCCRFCSDVAAEHGKTVIMEPRVGEVICSVDSMLRLIEHVDRPNFKANFDTGHFSAQRENVPLALAKLKGKFANIHISDNKPVNTDHLPVGDGGIDWYEFFRLLKKMKYDGYLGLDLGQTRSLVAGYKKSVERIQEIARELKFKVEV